MSWRRHLASLPAGFLENVGWQYLATAAVLGFGFLYSVIMAKALGATDFGLLSLATGVATVVFAALDVRLNEAVIRYLTEYLERKDAPLVLAVVKAALLVNVACGLLGAAVFVLFAGWIASDLVRDPRATSAVWLAAGYVFAQNVASSTSIGVLRVCGAFRTHAVVRTVNVVLQFGVAVAAWAGGWTVLTAMAWLIGVNVVTNGLLFILAMGELSRHAPLRTPAPLAALRGRRAEMQRFVLANYGLSLSSLPLRDLDITILGAAAPLETVGVYRIAKNFMAAVWQMSDPAFYVVYPEVAKFWSRREFPLLRAFIRRLTLLLAGGAGVLFVAGFVAAPIVIRRVLGVEFNDAGRIFRWMLPSLLVWMPLLWVHPVLCAADEPGRSLRASIAANLLALALYLTLIPPFGAAGAAAAYAAGVAAFPVLAFFSGRRAGLLFPAPPAGAAVLP